MLLKSKQRLSIVPCFCTCMWCIHVQQGLQYLVCVSVCLSTTILALSLTRLRGPTHQLVVCACVYEIYSCEHTPNLPCRAATFCKAWGPSSLYAAEGDRRVVQRCCSTLSTAASTLRETRSVDKYCIGGGPWPI